jgi:hypothetical protein
MAQTKDYVAFYPDSGNNASFVMHPLQAWASVRHRLASIDKRVYASR